MQEQLIQTSFQAMCQEILELQKHWNSLDTPAMSRRGVVIRAEGPQRLHEMINSNSLPEVALRVQGRDGVGRKSRIPWIRIYSEKHSPSATEGWYVVLLFAADGSAVFLSLNQGTMEPANNNLRPKPKQGILVNSTRAKAMLQGQVESRGNLIQEIDLRDPGSYGTGYEAGNVYAIKYQNGQIPDDGQIQSDLNSLLGLLSHLYKWDEAGQVDSVDPQSINSQLNKTGSRSWDEFIKWGRLIFQWDQFDAIERDYKLEIANNLKIARDAFLKQNGDWHAALGRAFGGPNNLTPWRIHSRFLKLIDENQDLMSEALTEIWKTPGDPIGTEESGDYISNLIPESNEFAVERVGNFHNVLSRAAEATGIKFNMLEVIGSFLLMAIDATKFPIYRASPLNKAYRLTNEPPPPRDATPVVRYERGMDFLSEVLSRCRKESINLRDILDAQSIVWSITKGGPPEHWDQSTKEDFLRYRGDLINGIGAPDLIELENEYWIVGADQNGVDQTSKFLDEGIWENSYPDRYLDRVREMNVGDRIATRLFGTQKVGLPFDNRGNTVSKIVVTARGTIVGNPGDGLTVEVDWEEPSEAREWYFFTYRTTVWHLQKDGDLAQKLIRFVFHNEMQDYGFFTSNWWGPDSKIDEPSPYSPQDMINEGIFLSMPEIERLIRRLKEKHNLILQGAPGVGKTFIARKLAYALMDSKDDSKVSTVQLHPSYSYEDFVRGYRPTDEAGKFELRNGPFIRLCEQAYENPDTPYVMIIDEINRGNLSQIFGEMFSLLESDKRGKVHEITPLYRYKDDDTIFVPDNLYIIGTMNTADRSLALVDYALRRRFSFITLEPKFRDPIYRSWLSHRGMSQDLVNNIINSMTILNNNISEDRQLGAAYQIGHSFFCPRGEDFSGLDVNWFEEIVDTEIKPLVEEYWFDEIDKVDAALKEAFGRS